MTEISLIIPAFNEASIIKRTVACATAFLRDSFDCFEIIVVDDGSTDGTARAALSGGEISLISYHQNMGKGYAIRQGVAAAKGKYIIFTDADMAYSFDYILDAIALLQEGDVVIGSRYIGTTEYNPYPLHRRVLSWGFASLVKKILQLDLSDTQCGFKAFHAAAAKNTFILTKIDDFGFDVELLYIAQELGYKILELPVCMQSVGNQTKVKMIKDSAKMFNHVMQIRKEKSRTIEKYEQ